MQVKIKNCEYKALACRIFFESSKKNHPKQSILANLMHNWKYGTPLSERRLLSMILVYNASV